MRLIHRRIAGLQGCGVPGIDADLKAAAILIEQALYNLGYGVAPPESAAQRRQKLGAGTTHRRRKAPAPRRTGT
jgi:hypothetical protein